MADITESDFNEWINDVEFLVNVLKESFESTDVSYYVDEFNEILYIELEGLAGYSNQEISEIAAPVLDELDLDFEDIILLPM
ncbi:MAG: hypothetical protein ACFCU6_15790 [Balneolaceae bacterium]